MTIPHAIEGLRQLKYTPGSEEPVHQHEQGQLIYPLRGVAKIVTPQHIWLLSPGRAIWLPGGLSHGLQAIDHVVTQNLYLTPQASRQFGLQCRGLAATPLLHTLIAAGLEETVSTERQALILALLSDELARLPASMRPRWRGGGKKWGPASARWRGCSAKRPISVSQNGVSRFVCWRRYAISRAA